MSDNSSNQQSGRIYVSWPDFVDTLKDTSLKTQEEKAEALGMKVPSFYSKYNEFKKKMGDKLPPELASIPSGKGGRGRRKITQDYLLELLNNKNKEDKKNENSDQAQ